MPKVVWLPESLRDIERLLVFVREKSPEASKRAAQQIKKAASNLESYPMLGKAMEDDTGRRELSTSFGKAGYILRYRLEGDNIIILRVWHHLELR